MDELEKYGLAIGTRVKVEEDWFTAGGAGVVIGQSNEEYFPVVVELDDPGYGNFRIVNVAADECVIVKS